MVIDLITCLIVAFGFYQGFSKGLIKTVFASLSILIAVIATFKFSGRVMDILENVLNVNQAIAFVLGFVLTFIIVMALVRFIGNKLEKLIKAIHIGGLNKIMGGAVLGLFYAILISYGVYFVNKVNLISEEQKQNSFTYALLEPLPRLTQDVGVKLIPLFSEFYERMIEAMDTLKEKSDEIEFPENNG